MQNCENWKKIIRKEKIWLFCSLFIWTTLHLLFFCYENYSFNSFHKTKHFPYLCHFNCLMNNFLWKGKSPSCPLWRRIYFVEFDKMHKNNESALFLDVDWISTFKKGLVLLMIKLSDVSENLYLSLEQDQYAYWSVHAQILINPF